jgi:hypothetical protein
MLDYEEVYLLGYNAVYSAVDLQRTTWRYIPEDSCANLKSYIMYDYIQIKQEL